mmetsp:Transcript_35575/g.113735  ORF Transcript_35575/g.113735 Transcript_35575/m.113735 type:complete len:190 (-) Transcript_35575:337-906(-)
MGRGGHGWHHGGHHHGGHHHGGWGGGWGGYGGYGWGRPWGWGYGGYGAPVIVGAAVGAAAVGGATYARPAQVVQRTVVVEDPNYRTVQCRRPAGVSIGSRLRIEVDGRPYHVVVPEGVPENGIFHVQIPLNAPPPVQVATPVNDTTATTTRDSLPAGWEEKQTPEGRTYYVDHNTKTTHWNRPVHATVA